jgi:hypothetical protein
MPEAGRSGSGARRTAGGPRRQARSGPPPDSTDRVHSEGATGEAGGENTQPPLCSIAFCPICTVVTALGEARPELVEHLVMASREVLLAVRGLIDARLEGMTPPTKLERLTIE